MPALNLNTLEGIFTQFDKGFNDALGELYKHFDSYTSFTAEFNSNSEKTDYKFYQELPALEEWVGSRRVASIKAGNYEIVNKKWSSAISMAREHLEDDTLGIGLMRIRQLANEANRGVSREVYQTLQAGGTGLGLDGLAFFAAHTGGTNQDTGGGGNYWYLIDTTKLTYKPIILQWRDRPQLDSLTNPNMSDHVWKNDEFLYGVRTRFGIGYGFWQTAYRSNQTLNGTNLEAAAEAMMAFQDANGNPLGIMPDTLVVHPGNWAEANRLFKADLISDGTNYVSNIHKGAFKVIVSEWLTD